MNKIIKWILIITGAIIFLFASAVIYITINYEEIVKKIIVSGLNKYVDNTDINVGSIKFSILQHFPEATVEFINISAKFQKKFNTNPFLKLRDDTLFRAKSLSLSFNILDIFHNKYRIRQFEIKHGKATILIDEKGKDNYHFWKAVPQNNASPDFKLELNRLKFLDFRFEYRNLAKKIYFRANTHDLVLAGDFSSDSYSLKTSGKINLEKLIIENINYVNSDNISLRVNFTVINNDYIIKIGEIETSNLVFIVSGKYVSSDPDQIDIKIDGRDINIDSFISLMPAHYKKYLNDYKSEGNFYFTALISGKISRLLTPNIKVSFGITGGTIEKKHTRLKLAEINIEGTYDNGPGRSLAGSVLTLKKFKAALGKSRINGLFRAVNFSHPEIKFEADMSLNLNEIQSFIHIDTIKNISGNISCKINFEGKTKAIDNFSRDDFENSMTQARIVADNVNIDFINSQNSFSGLSGVFILKNNDVFIDSARIKVNNNDFFIKGSLKNMINHFMFDKEKYEAEVLVRSSSCNLDDLFMAGNKNEHKRNDKNSSGSISLPSDAGYKINLEFKHLAIGKFNAKNVRGSIDYRNKLLMAQNLFFETLDGKILANGNIEQLENKKFLMTCNTQIENVDIRKLFYTFDNFGQTFIADRHLNGKVNAKVDFSSEWTSNFDFDENKLIAEGKIEILNGELINFEPMLKLSDFIIVKELKHIKFSRLNNEIYIKDRKITIPQMTINSSAINIDLSGEQYFNYDICYHVRVLLSDLLSKNAKKIKRENEEFGVEEDDGTGKINLFLLIKGNVDDYRVTYDFQSAGKNLKQNLKEEKVNLKTVLHKEFGVYKKDSSVLKNEIKKNTEKKNKKTNFTIEWDNDTLKQQQK